MRKFLISVFALFAVFAITGCEMTYDKDYLELIQYYCNWGDASEWNDFKDPSKTLMTYDAASATYQIEIETPAKNQRFVITQGADYAIKYGFDISGVCSQDPANQALFPKSSGDGVSADIQTVLPTVGTYIITFDATTELYSVAAK